MSQPVQLPGFVEALVPPLDHWGYLAAGFLIFAGRPRRTHGLVPEHRRRGRDRLHHCGARRQHRPHDRRDRRPHAGTAPGRHVRLTGGTPRQSRVLLHPPRWQDRHRGPVHRGPAPGQGIIAGMTRMPGLSFLACRALGAVPWVFTWPIVGSLAGNHIQASCTRAAGTPSACWPPRWSSGTSSGAPSATRPLAAAGTAPGVWMGRERAGVR